MNQAGMNNPDAREHLSAGIDGELSTQELRFLLRRLDHDAGLQQAWTRYHVARDGVRRQLPPLASAGFAARVMAAIEQETAPVATPASPSSRHWLRWSAGGAIAASVAVAALLLVQPAGETARTEAVAVQSDETAVPEPVTQPSSVPATVPPWLSGNSAELYSQRASATLGGVSRLMPYARDGVPMHRYRTLDNHDGSYLLLLDPQQQRATTPNPAFAH